MTASARRLPAPRRVQVQVHFLLMPYIAKRLLLPDADQLFVNSVRMEYCSNPHFSDKGRRGPRFVSRSSCFAKKLKGYAGDGRNF